jgi:hypothetical protein
MVQLKTVDGKRVAPPPTCQNMLEALAHPDNMIFLNSEIVRLPAT